MIHAGGETKRAKLIAAFRNFRNFSHAPETRVSFQNTPISIAPRDLNAMTISNTDSPSEISIIQLGQSCFLRCLNCTAADTIKYLP